MFTQPLLSLYIHTNFLRNTHNNLMLIPQQNSVEVEDASYSCFRQCHSDDTTLSWLYILISMSQLQYYKSKRWIYDSQEYMHYRNCNICQPHKLSMCLQLENYSLHFLQLFTASWRDRYSEQTHTSTTFKWQTLWSTTGSTKNNSWKKRWENVQLRNQPQTLP